MLVPPVLAPHLPTCALPPARKRGRRGTFTPAWCRWPSLAGRQGNPSGGVSCAAPSPVWGQRLPAADGGRDYPQSTAKDVLPRGLCVVGLFSFIVVLAALRAFFHAHLHLLFFMPTSSASPGTLLLGPASYCPCAATPLRPVAPHVDPDRSPNGSSGGRARVRYIPHGVPPRPRAVAAAGRRREETSAGGPPALEPLHPPLTHAGWVRVGDTPRPLPLPPLFRHRHPRCRRVPPQGLHPQRHL